MEGRKEDFAILLTLIPEQIREMFERKDSKIET
jgi:hypothetical protein